MYRGGGAPSGNPGGGLPAGNNLGDIIYFDGTNWVSSNEGTPSIGDILVFDGTSWVLAPQGGPGGGLPGVTNIGDILFSEDGASWEASAGGVPVEGSGLIWTGTRWAPDSSRLTPLVFHITGDSNTLGTGTGVVVNWRMSMYGQLRAWRDDFEIIGAFVDAVENLSTFATWYHSAVSGYTMQDEAANFAAQAATAGQANVIIDMLGTNNIVVLGETAAQMMTARAALNAAYLAANPNAKIVMIPPPPFVAGTITGANLAAWNTIRAAYLVLLQAYVAATPNTYLVDVTTLGLGDYVTDGVHLNSQGQGRLGVDVADYLDRVILGVRRRGVPLPRAMRERPPRYALQVPNGAADRIISGANTAFAPGVESFAFAIDYYTPNTGTNQYNIIAYGGAGFVPNYYQLFHSRGELSFFWRSAAGTGVITAQPQTRAIQAGKWHRIVIICYLNGANSSIGMYVNARLVGLVQGQAAWAAFTAQAISIGLGGSFPGADDTYYGRYRVWKGAAIAKPGTMLAMRAVEKDYYEDASLFAGDLSASYTFNNTVNGDINGSAALTLVGGANFTAPYAPNTTNGNTPQRPWEMPQWL